MTATVSASFNVPQTQNTATVLEFRCLWTADIKRKQKRWQDGRLKFHTFNKRVMVYDERPNFVGDTHWREDYEFGDGEELELDRGPALVQVGECIGKNDQDLTELIDKRVKDREERVAARNASPSRSSVIRNINATPAASSFRPKPLNALLGTPSGQYGRASISTRSPFEERRMAKDNREAQAGERLAKRRKPNESPPSKGGYAQNLMGTPLIFSSRPPSTATIRHEPLRVKPANHQIQSQSIDLTIDGDDEVFKKRNDVGDKKELERTSTQERIRKKKQERNQNGYASSLTGASLALSTPRTIPSPRAKERRAPGNEVLSHTKRHTNTEDATYEDDCLLQSNPPGKPVASKTQPSKTVSHNERPRKDAPLPFISSPRSSDREQAQLKPRRLQKDLAQTLSNRQNSVAQPVSTLRIKLRPPHKMMMLMKRSSSRGDSSDTGQVASKRPRHSATTPVEPPLSQSTVHLNNFRQKQQERLQARLKGRWPSIDQVENFPEPAQPASDDEALASDGHRPSSPIDSGINHQMIDSFLSKKQVVEKPRIAERNTLVSGTTLQDETFSSHQVAREKIDRQLRRDGSPQTRSDGGETSLPAVHPQAATTVVDQSSVAHELVSTTQRTQAARPRVTEKIDNKARPCEKSTKSTLQSSHTSHEAQDLGSVREIQRLPRPQVLGPRALLNKTLPGHVSGAVFAATDNFRAKLFPRELPRINDGPTEGNRTGRQKPLSSLISKVEPRSSEAGINLSRTPSHVMSADPGDGESEINVATNHIDTGQVVSHTLGRSTLTLMNPTNAQSSLRSLFQEKYESTPQLPEPPLLPANHCAIRLPGNAPNCGPWSRESFDLFGTWRPPGRETGTTG